MNQKNSGRVSNFICKECGGPHISQEKLDGLNGRRLVTRRGNCGICGSNTTLYHYSNFNYLNKENYREEKPAENTSSTKFMLMVFDEVRKRKNQIGSVPIFSTREEALLHSNNGTLQILEVTI